MRHIILEGPDGAGKTTIARILCHALGMEYSHEGPPPPGVEPFTHYWLQLGGAEYPTVFDRLHLGEIVYGPLLRGKPGLTPEEVMRLNDLAEDMDALIVLCLPPWENCLAATRAKEELIKDETVLRAAYDGWKVLSQNTSQFTGRIFDYTRRGDFVPY